MGVRYFRIKSLGSHNLKRNVPFQNENIYLLIFKSIISSSGRHTKKTFNDIGLLRGNLNNFNVHGLEPWKDYFAMQANKGLWENIIPLSVRVIT